MEGRNTLPIYGLYTFVLIGMTSVAGKLRVGALLAGGNTRVELLSVPAIASTVTMSCKIAGERLAGTPLRHAVEPLAAPVGRIDLSGAPGATLRNPARAPFAG